MLEYIHCMCKYVCCVNVRMCVCGHVCVYVRMCECVPEGMPLTDYKWMCTTLFIIIHL